MEILLGGMVLDDGRIIHVAVDIDTQPPGIMREGAHYRIKPLLAGAVNAYASLLLARGGRDMRDGSFIARFES